ncbi:putative phage integrase, catalytic core [Phaeobacter inhibens]|uniref:tyrosine-type recombinase/integrase n=1 Tax=Phaeobacter inhibens TaxID=221822 RepID=UPI000C9BC1F7|nr:integrase arm-type DNA-binding domain-containing protein [Phaeobacter inhibens]AUR10504.1 putative phage integrase, catalytic core [Phaeobacter inhibens]
MPRRAKELTALEVKRLKHPGHGRNHTVAVGGVSGLLLQITPNSGKSWVLRISVGNKRREFGLGSYPETTLGTARDRARDLKEKVREGIDPIAERKAKKSALIAEQRRGLTFEAAIEKFLSAKLDQFSNPKHRQQWTNTLRTYAQPELGDMLVQDITVRDILRTLNPIWHTKTETASRVRGRIEAVLSWATVAGHREGDNPARWSGNLSELLPAPSKITKEVNHPALQIDDVQRWLAALRSMNGMARYALEFTLLTAVRSQEVRGARWDEINLETATWIIPAERMKMDRTHRIPLSTGALHLLETVPRFEGSPLMFTAPRGGQLSDMTLSAAMKRLHKSELAASETGYVDQKSGRPAVPHGLRSTFRDWIAERTHFPGDVAEMALAHKVSSEVEGAYRRQQMVEKRRPLMQAWSDFVNGEQSDSIVIPFVGSEG